MNTLVKVTLAAALILSIAVPYIAFMIGEKTKGRYKKALAGNVVMFFGVMAITCVFFLSGNAYAASETAASSATGLGYLSAALSVGLACIGGGIAAASAALGAISEDGSILGKSLIFVGLAEGVCLYGLVVAFMILGRL